MSRLFTSFWAGSRPSLSHRAMGMDLEEPLLQHENSENNKEGALDERLSERCELRIEGMTCGSCVEVRFRFNCTLPLTHLVV